MTEHRIIDGSLYLKSEVAPSIPSLPCTDNYHQIEQYDVPKAKALMAEGYTVPHPIHDPALFNYAGPYDPYYRQKETAGFLAWHDRAWCLNDMGCVDSQTEFLTPDGWKNITEYQEGDLVAQYDNETDTSSFKKPKGYVDLPNKEPMIEFFGRNGMTEVVTPDHTMYVRTGNRRANNPRVAMPATDLVKRINSSHYKGNKFAPKHRGNLESTQASVRNFNMQHVDSGVNGSANAMRAAAFMILCWGPDKDKSTFMVPEYAVPLWACVIRNTGLNMRATGRKAAVLATRNSTKQLTLREFECPPGDDNLTDLLMATLQTEQMFAAAAVRDVVAKLSWLSKDGGYYSGSDNPIQAWHVASEAAMDATLTMFAAFGGRVISTGISGKNEHPSEVEGGDRKDYRAYRFVAGITRKPNTKVQPTNLNMYSMDCYRLVNRERKYCFVTDTGYWVARRKDHIFITGNTGKTASAIWATEFLRQTEGLRKTLIVTTLSTMDVVWKQELFALYPARSAGIVAGDKKRKAMLIKQPFKYLILNHDGLRQEYILEALMALPDLDLVILDEASAFRNHSTGRYKAMAKLLRAKPNLKFWPMTGTPAPQAPTDVWALSRLVNPDGTPPYFQRFKQETMMKVSHFEWVAKPGSSEIVQRVMHPAIRVKAEDCEDIPKLMPPTRVEAEMSSEQTKYFNIMKDQMVMEYKQQSSSHVVTAVNAAVLMTKLMQICCGNLYDVNKDTIHLPNEKRLQSTFTAAIEAGAMSDTKVIIFVPFKHSQKAVLDYFNGKGLKSALVNGDTKGKDRKLIFNAFQDGVYEDPEHENIRVLIAHPRVAAHGLTLTAASCIIWFAPYASLEYYLQANARISRTGQLQKHLRVVHIGSHGIEWQLYRKLEKKGIQQNDILALYEGLMNETSPTQ